MHTKIIDLLNNQDWADIIIKVTSYAQQKLKASYWLNGTGPISGKTAGDYTNEAITRTFESARKWNPNKCPGIEKYLKGVVSSLISSDITGSENKHSADFDSLKPDAHPSTQTKELIDETAKGLSPKVQVLIKATQKKGDEDSEMIIYAIIEDGDTKPRDLASNLGIPLSQVNNALKRLRRLAQKAFEKSIKT